MTGLGGRRRPPPRRLLGGSATSQHRRRRCLGRLARPPRLGARFGRGRHPRELGDLLGLRRLPPRSAASLGSATACDRARRPSGFSGGLVGYGGLGLGGSAAPPARPPAGLCAPLLGCVLGRLGSSAAVSSRRRASVCGHLLADLGERRGERVVDAALGLLDRLRRVVARAPRDRGARAARGAARAGPVPPRPA